MALPWHLALRAIPWATILANAPVIAKSAGTLLAEARAPRRPPGAPNQLAALADRVDTLEQRDRDTALLLGQMTSQIAALTTATEVLEARVRWLLLFAIMAAAFAALAVGLSLFAG
jgi:hypothetical protein